MKFPYGKVVYYEGFTGLNLGMRKGVVVTVRCMGYVIVNI